MNTDTPETDNEADDAHNMCLDYDCQSKNDNIQTPIVVPADFARKLERERDEARKRADTMFAEHVDIIDQALYERDEIRAQLREEQQLHVQTLNERDKYAGLLSAAMKWVYASECDNENRQNMIEDFELLELTPQFTP